MKSFFFLIAALCCAQVHAATVTRCQMELYCTGGSVGFEGSGAGIGDTHGTSTSYRRVRVNELATGFSFVAIDTYEETNGSTARVTINGAGSGTIVASALGHAFTGTGCSFVPATVGTSETQSGVTCTAISQKQVFYPSS